MSKEQNTGAPKPLNCMYCASANFYCGTPTTYICKLTPPLPLCTSYDVAPELIDLFLLLMSDSNSLMDIYNWLPYNCGHFIPRGVRQSCRVCKKTFIMPEWKLVQKQHLLTFCLATVCSKECHVIYINGGSNG